MRTIFLDLEMNGVPWKIRKRCGLRMEIIEIGAVMLNDENEETGCFREFVKPQLSDAMEPAVEKLTNIHFDQLESAPPLEDVLRRFLIWSTFPSRSTGSVMLNTASSPTRGLNFTLRKIPLARH